MQSKAHKTSQTTARPRHAKPISVSITRASDVGNHLRQRQPNERDSLLAAIEQWPSLIPDQETTSARQRNSSLLVAASAADAPLKDPPELNDVLSAPGERLDPHTRDLMERRFGADFSCVRVHHGVSAAQSARVMAANAYTVGQNIVFGEGRYAPRSATGQRLLAHELAHTIQQRGIQRSPIGSLLSTEDPSLEAEADLAATAITSGTGFPSLRRTHRSIVQRQSSPTSTYNITLTYPPNHTERHERLILPDALRVLRRFADRISAHLEGGYEGHRYLQEIHDDQFIVAGISDLFGGRSIPSLMIWVVPRARLQQARTTIAQGDVARATTQLQQAANETRDAERRVYEYREGTIAGAERAIFALEVVEVAGAVAATVATGGTAGVFVGAGYAGVQRLAGEATSVAIGLQDEIDWAGVAFDTLFALVAGRFGGQLGSKIAARLGGRITARVASSLIVGRASGIAHAVAREVFDAARGRTELTVDGFIDRIASQLSARAIFLDLVAHGVGTAAASARRTPTEPSPQPPRLSGPQRQPIQGGRPGRVDVRDYRQRGTSGRRTSTPRATPSRTRESASATGRRGNLALAQEPQPIVEPVVEPAAEPAVRPVPSEAGTPQAPARASTPTDTTADVTAGVAIAAATATTPPAPSTPPVEVRLVLPIQKSLHAHLYGRLVRERALEHVPGLDRDTAQAENWDRELRPGGPMEIIPEIWQEFETRGIEVNRRLRPNWSRAVERIALQVDHRVEFQLLNAANRTWGDTIANYELLDQPSNGSSGSTLRNNIQVERDRLATTTGDPTWLTRPITFTRLIVPPGPSPGERWLPDEIQQGEHYYALLEFERGRF